MSSSAAAAAAPSSSSSPPSRRRPRSRIIRMVSYNVSMAEPSAQAPSHWWTCGGDSDNGSDRRQHYEHASDLVGAILGQGFPAAAHASLSSNSNNSNNNNSTSNLLTEAEVHLRDEILRTHPDVVALQECPTSDWSARVLGAPFADNPNHQRHQYVSVGTTRSHCGYVDLLVREDWAWERIDLQRRQQDDTPGVAAVVQVPLLLDGAGACNSSSSSAAAAAAAAAAAPSFARLAVASSHLAPHRENAPTRLDQLQRLVGAMEQQPNATNAAAGGCDGEGTDLVLLGDMNMRKDEDGRAERIGWAPPSSSASQSRSTSSSSRSGGSGNARNNNSGGGLLDAWKEAGSDPAARDTWDSYVNRYHGSGAFEFRCRFDRTYYRPAAADTVHVHVHGAGAEVRGRPSLRVADFGLVGNRPILRERGGGGPGHFLSDHFGMSVTFEVARSEGICDDDGGDDEDYNDDGTCNDNDVKAGQGETQPSKKKTKR